MKNLKKTEFEIKYENGRLHIRKRGSRKIMAILLGIVIQRIGAEKTEEFLSDIAVSALILHKKHKKSEKNCKNLHFSVKKC